MKTYIGIDIGSRNTKLVVLESPQNNILYYSITPTGVNPKTTVADIYKQALTSLNLSPADISKIYTTGYGRKLYPADKAVSEISCHAHGVLYSNPEVRTIIDIGGQDSKIICLDEKQQIRDFVMNDKCAAGTGRFLEMVALRLEASCSELSNLASDSNHSIHLSNTCVVFAESEIVGLIAEGTTPSDIARAIHNTIAERIAAQLNQLKWEAPVAFTGGVALNNDLGACISNLIESKVTIPPNPEITGALGAAILAAGEVE